MTRKSASASKSANADSALTAEQIAAQNRDAHDAWKRHNGDKSAAARILGIPVKELSSRIVAHLDSLKSDDAAEQSDDSAASAQSDAAASDDDAASDDSAASAQSDAAASDDDAQSDDAQSDDTTTTTRQHYRNCPKCGYTYPKPRARQMCQSDAACAKRCADVSKQASRRVDMSIAAQRSAV